MRSLLPGSFLEYAVVERMIHKNWGDVIRTNLSKDVSKNCGQTVPQYARSNYSTSPSWNNGLANFANVEDILAKTRYIENLAVPKAFSALGFVSILTSHTWLVLLSLQFVASHHFYEPNAKILAYGYAT